MEDLAALLDVARGVVAREVLDVEVIVDLLDSLPIFDFDVPGQGAIIHAQMVAGAALDADNAIHALIARCALERVVALLERRVAISFSVSHANHSTLSPRRSHGDTYDPSLIP